MSTFESTGVHGILAIPRISLNGNLYLASELQKSDGLTIPVYSEHEDIPGTELYNPQAKPKGQINLRYDPQKQQLRYSGTITSNKLIRAIKSGSKRFISLFGTHHDQGSVIDGSGRTVVTNVPLGMGIHSASIVSNPGIPETTVHLESNGERVLWEYLNMPLMVEERRIPPAERTGMSDDDFAYISPKGDRKLPIHDAAHVRNALARFSQTQIPDDERPKVLRTIKRRAKQFGVKVSESDVFNGIIRELLTPYENETNPFNVAGVVQVEYRQNQFFKFPRL